MCVCLCVCLSICLSVCLSICLSVCLLLRCHLQPCPFQRALCPKPNTFHIHHTVSHTRTHARAHAYLCLEVLVWVPVAVEDDNCVCRLQVEAQTACTGREDKDVNVRVGSIECLHLPSALFIACAAVQAAGTNKWGALVMKR